MSGDCRRFPPNAGPPPAGPPREISSTSRKSADPRNNWRGNVPAIAENGYPLHCPLGIWYACRVDTTRHPLAGLDYPRTFQAMDERFRDDEACREYIRRLRWPKGFTCLHCGEVGEPWVMAGGWLRCRACRKKTSLTVGTIF